ncbi:hypothetical protein NE237_009686 [Protea cynaroides]|uniref:Uncharacterized protein n=1 Tax=Protea cynaroides TaxID=273540 RepID=A0A9Q0KZ43_9MAGN|nr:hypothetical protein NE237_009686 [Protea cynaroides]
MGEKKGFRKGEGRGGVSQRRSASHGSFNSLLLNSLLPLASLPWRTSISSLDNQRLPKNLNCLRVVECISGVDNRAKQLRSEVAFKILINCLDGKVGSRSEASGIAKAGAKLVMEVSNAKASEEIKKSL